jgi:mRNA-degrading endonuclease RelE of RelBE toxin-antitoxin system
MKIEFLKPAEIELDEAFKYYESQLDGLGFRFQSEIAKSLTRINSYPNSYQKIGKYARRCLVQKFPYGVIYQFKQEANLLLIVAIAHLHRKPDYWLSREL